MKHVNKFNEFMKNTVNLNQSRIDTLTSRVNVINRFLKKDDVFSEFYISTDPQGSYSHRTIIKPLTKSPEFDADLVFYLKENSDWEPKDYIENLYKQFKVNSNYKDISGRGTRCITLDYAGDFHLDIVPCIKRDSVWDEETFHVCNRSENIEEKTDPQGYTEWLKDKNKKIENNNLVKSIRLFKYLRGIKQTFSCKSILLTTLVANQARLMDSIISGFDDLPSSFKILINRLNEFLQENDEMPIIYNPVNNEENFNRHWTQEKYENYRSQINKYNDWVNDAYDEEDQKESIKKWQKIFGDEFAKQVISESSTKQTQSDNTINNFPVPAYVEKPKWPMFGMNSLSIKVTVHRTNDGSPEIATIQRDIIGVPLGKHLKVRMEYLGGISSTHQLYWQVVNTGQEAIRNNCPRGSIFSGDKIRWEDTLYTGVHWVECFIVDRKKKICTGRSGRFFVNIG